MRFHPRVEILEIRFAPATYIWDPPNPLAAGWLDNVNWYNTDTQSRGDGIPNGSGVPGASDVAIFTGNPPLPQVGGGSNWDCSLSLYSYGYHTQSVAELQLQADYQSTLTVSEATTLQVSSGLTLAGGTIQFGRGLQNNGKLVSAGAIGTWTFTTLTTSDPQNSGTFVIDSGSEIQIFGRPLINCEVAIGSFSDAGSAAALSMGATAGVATLGDAGHIVIATGGGLDILPTNLNTEGFAAFPDSSPPIEIWGGVLIVEPGPGGNVVLGGPVTVGKIVGDNQPVDLGGALWLQNGNLECSQLLDCNTQRAIVQLAAGTTLQLDQGYRQEYGSFRTRGNGSETVLLGAPFAAFGGRLTLGSDGRPGHPVANELDFEGLTLDDSGYGPAVTLDNIAIHLGVFEEADGPVWSRITYDHGFIYGQMLDIFFHTVDGPPIAGDTFDIMRGYLDLHFTLHADWMQGDQSGSYDWTAGGGYLWLMPTFTGA